MARVWHYWIDSAGTFWKSIGATSFSASTDIPILTELGTQLQAESGVTLYA